MKQKHKNICILLMTMLGLTSCNFRFEVGPAENSSSSSLNDVIDSSKTDTSSTDSSNDNNSSADIISQDKIARAYADGLDIREKYNANYLPCLPSTGNSKMLVVPVKLKNTDVPVAEATLKSALNKAFFGKSEDTGWESVSSFYKKSSYGKLNITGEVSNILETSVSYNQISRADDNSVTDLTDKILKEAYDMYFVKENHNFRDFDSNNDGKVDSIYLVYLSEENPDATGLWAYTYWYEAPTEQELQRYGHLSAYCWSSYNFMLHDSRFSYDKPDAHTYIHESGHLQSLDDYYNYYDASTSPVGGVDMMDHNIGDHNSFTKYSLGWTVPEVVTEKDDITTKEIKLRPFESTGDSLLIANNFNGTSLDEFLILEYYTPTGLNKFDSDRGYEGSSDRCFTQPGVKIYHADQRIGRLTYNDRLGWYWDDKFIDRIVTTNNSYSKILASNALNHQTKKGFSESGFNLITLLDGNKKASSNLDTKFERTNVMANNSTLFKANDKFASHYADFKFNDGSSLNYDIEIGNMDSEGVTIKLTKK